jgi:hypothetical protein
MSFQAGVETGGTVAEALANVVFQRSGLRFGSGFAELSARVSGQFGGNERAEFCPAIVSQMRPDKVEEFVDEDQS